MMTPLTIASKLHLRLALAVLPVDQGIFVVKWHQHLTGRIKYSVEKTKTKTDLANGNTGACASRARFVRMNKPGEWNRSLSHTSLFYHSTRSASCQSTGTCPLLENNVPHEPETIPCLYDEGTVAVSDLPSARPSGNWC